MTDELPEPLRNEEVLSYVRALHAQFKASGAPGHFGLVFHYSPGGILGDTHVVAPTMIVKRSKTP